MEASQRNDGLLGSEALLKEGVALVATCSVSSLWGREKAGLSHVSAGGARGGGGGRLKGTSGMNSSEVAEYRSGSG